MVKSSLVILKVMRLNVTVTDNFSSEGIPVDNDLPSTTVWYIIFIIIFYV